METIYVWLIGLLLGVKHALDADHLVAVSAIVSRNQTPYRSALTGLFWGVGHTGSLLAAALVILWLGINVPASWERLFEFIVGVLLVWLGISVVRRAVGLRLHVHGHQHGRRVHIHFHSHAESEAHTHEHGRSILVGMAHGLAGSAALMLLVVSQIKSIVDGIIYVLIFGLGSIVGMLIFGGLIGIPLRLSAQSGRLNFLMRCATGLMSLGLGLITIAANWP